MFESTMYLLESVFAASNVLVDGPKVVSGLLLPHLCGLSKLVINPNKQLHY